jgi:hypothetical protein
MPCFPSLGARAVGAALLLSAATAASAQMRITEFMYSGSNGEFVEFTNVGSSAIDLTGWSFDDDSDLPGSFALGAFGVVQPNESVILTDAASATAFRTAWNLCDAVKVIAAQPEGLGRNDRINLYDASDALVDRLNYGDQTFPGTIRAQNASGWVSAAGLGGDAIAQWTLASVGDGEGSILSAGNDLGSPGRSQRAPTPSNPCTPQIRISEFAYSAGSGEFIEFTNVGTAAVDLTGWSFDDSGRVPGETDLSPLGVLAAGESAILTEAVADTFRTAWGLCPAAKVLGGNSNNLGRSDEINLYDADDALIDRLTYGDQTFPGTIRTENASGWVDDAGLGANAIAQWLLSTAGDAEGSIASATGDIGSPARSQRPSDPVDPCPPLPPQMRITEYMYSGPDDEFIEFTNVGAVPIDMGGWSFDDDSRVAGTVDLSAFGTVQPGESVLLTEATESAFRSAWSLCAGVRIIGDLATNLGNGDEINLFDANDTLADRLTYPNGGPPLANGASAWVPATGLGINDATQWVVSTLADVEGSVASSAGAIGRPSRSERRSVDFDPCLGVPGAPTVQVVPAQTSRFLDLPGNGSGSIGGVIGDPTDPAATVGIALTFADPDGDAALLDITVESSNPSVVDAAGLTLTGSGAQRMLRIVPHGAGRSLLRIRATDAALNVGSYQINYAASAAALEPATTRFHSGASDASTAIAIDADWMLIADDENQVLRLYARHDSGLHQAGFDFTDALALTDLDGGVPREVDIEASTRLGARLFWLGSHGNQATGSPNARPNRRRVFATDLSGNGDSATLAYAGRYDHLLGDLVAWDEADGHGLGAGALGFAASSAANVSPEIASGLNIEGLTIAPDGSTALVAFRAPRAPLASRNEALVIPVLQFDALVTGAAPGSRAAGSASFGAPILLDLGGRAIRSIERNGAGDYLIVGGPSGAADLPAADFRLFRWSGLAADVPLMLSTDLAALDSAGAFEGIVEVPAGAGAATSVQLVVDNGDAVFYGDGIAAKDLAERRQAKFRSERVTIDLPQLQDAIFSSGFESP